MHLTAAGRAARILLILAALFTSPRSSAAAAQTGPSTSPRALAARDIAIDVSPAARVISLWNMPIRGDSKSLAEASRIAATPAYRALRRFVREQFRCMATEPDVARALVWSDSGACGFGMEPAFRDKDSLSALAFELNKRKTALSARIASDVASYLPTAPRWGPIRLWIVIGSQTMFDAATMGGNANGDSLPIVLVNLTDVLAYGPTTEARMDGLRHVLAHEAFHAGLHQVEPTLPGWAAYRGGPTSELAHVREVMVDEGMAHYLDWRTRPGSDSMFTWQPGVRENFSFAQLAIACKRLRGPGGRADKLELAQLAGVGPLWSKYGAISGMFAAYRIEMAYGRAALRRLVGEGPEAFLRAYARVAAGRPGLNSIPQELIYYK